MFRIALISMPFHALRLPSLALTQLKAVVEERCGGGVAVDICYLNQDVGRHLGVELYSFLANTNEANTAGLGDWFFRPAAFPDLADNADVYFRRYFPHRSGASDVIRRSVLEARPAMDALLDRLIDQYVLYDYDLVGFTSMFAQNVASFALARKLKAIVPEQLVVIGGANCEPPMGQYIADHVPALDFVFAGPALRSFPDFVSYARQGDLESCQSIPGVYRASRDRPESYARGSMGQDLDIDHPVPLDFSGFLQSLSSHFPDGDVEPSLLFETSRGCWWGERAHCTFCGLNGSTMNYRAMRSDLAIETFSRLFLPGSNVHLYECVDNIMPRHYPREVFPHISVPAGATMFYEVKADVSEEDVAAMARAGVRLVQPGIEALATSTLKLMKKGSSSFQNVDLLKRCIRYDIGPIWNLLVGFPGEGEAVYRHYVAQVPRLMHLPPPSGVFPIRFDRYSPYFTRATEYGLDLHPLDFYDLVYPFPPEALRNIAYYFSDRKISAPYFVEMASWLGRMQACVEAWKRRWSDSSEDSFPKLYLDASSDDIVVDARGAAVRRHDVGPFARQVLAALDEPLNAAMLAQRFPEASDSSLDAAVAALDQAGFVFIDGERMLSLVHAAEPNTPSTILRMLAPPVWHTWLHRQSNTHVARESAYASVASRT